MEKLDKLRQEIDLLDQKLLTLLEQRAQVSQQIGLIKRQIEQTGVNPQREAQVIELLCQNIRLLTKQELIEIYQPIFKHSLRLQQP